MEIFFIAVVSALLLLSIAAVIIGIRNDGRGHLPPVNSGRPWHGNSLWDVRDPRDLYLDRPYQPRGY